jgi:hypothetical protein
MPEPGGRLSSRMSRRQALKSGAVVVGSTVWVAPVVQALTMSQASAERPSGGSINAGRGNGSEPNRPTDLDPGNSGGRNRGGD